MATEIFIKDVSSYRKPVTITDLKKVNVFYGLNGTGKTTITQLLAARDRSIGRFKGCKITFADGKPDPEILVYNQDFVQNNFLSTNQLKGIFTLDHENVEAETAIEEAREEISKLTNMRPQHVSLVQAYNQQETTDRNQLKDKVWEEKTRFENTSTQVCLDGFMGSKEVFLNNLIKSIPLIIDEENIPNEFKNIESELQQLIDKNSEERKTIDLIVIDLNQIELDVIFSEKIIGSSDSYLSDIISKLEHADWINEGLQKHLPQSNECPFCKQSLTEELRSKLLSHIDKEYQKKQQYIENLLEKYKNHKSTIEEILSIYIETIELKSNPEIILFIERLKAQISSNIELISSKLREPSHEIELINTFDTIQEINDLVHLVNLGIKDFNQKLKNKQKSIKDIKSKFWSLLRKKYDLELSGYIQRQSERNEGKDKSNGKLSEIDLKIIEKNTIISLNQQKTKNVDFAINRINSRLLSFGVIGFEIKRLYTENKDQYLYHIVRNGEKHNETFRTLSEGEKTLISFLYFLEECVGISDPEKARDTGNRIIVIDDPISSLSFNLVFDVSVLIKEIFLNKDLPYRQVFIFTHHLYFLHEILGVHKVKIPKDWALYRVTKYTDSNVTSLGRTEIQNNYDNNWRILKEIQSGQAPKVLLPNVVRNILEQYFSFVHAKDSLVSALDELSKEHQEPFIKSFDRYINRESHSDATNFIDANEIDVDKYLSYLEAIFLKTGHFKHYEAMMNKAVLITTS